MSAVTTTTATPPTATPPTATPTAGTASRSVGRRGEARRGALAMLPMLAGIAPLGIVVGAAAATISNSGAGLAGTWTILSGASQAAVLEQLGAGAGLTTIVAGGLLVGARLAVYSTALAPIWEGADPRVRTFGAALVTDPSWALTSQRLDEGASPRAARHYFFGATATLMAAWSLVVGIGFVLGSRLEHVDRLAVALPILLAALAVPALADRAGRASVATAATVAVLTASWSSGTGLLVAIVAGTVAGLVTENVSENTEDRS